MVDPGSNLERNYLVIMDAVPGGTGYLKALYEEKAANGRSGEGVLDLMRRAKVALESCSCRRLNPHERETDGCYRCIRTYHLQYNTERISRERAIRALEKVLASAERLTEGEKIDSVSSESLFASVLEKRFVESLQRFVEEKGGNWDKAILRGRLGFRFSLGKSSKVWELELQPRLGEVHGVKAECQPDFLLTIDDLSVRPIAIFTDGYEFHVNPNNRLADDFKKRRAIIQSGNYLLWNVTWNDLVEGANQVPLFEGPIAQLLNQLSRSMISNGSSVPPIADVVSSGVQQLCSFIQSADTNSTSSWQELVHHLVGTLHGLLASQRTIDLDGLSSGRGVWKEGGRAEWISRPDGEWTVNDKLSIDGDYISYSRVGDVVGTVRRFDRSVLLGRLDDDPSMTTQTAFQARWQRFLRCLNLFQFASSFSFWTTGEAKRGDIIELPVAKELELEGVWKEVEETVCRSVRIYIRELRAAEVPEPQCEFYNDEIDDDAFAELAWPDVKVALLVGEQADFASKWQGGGWRVVTLADLQVRGTGAIVDFLKRR